jgi:N-acyl-L-homoserine lactone synthetase
MKYRFKRAETDEELSGVFQLNHRVFAEELGQYQKRDDRVLIDRYHDSQIYFIAISGESVVGMISAHSGRPYSIEQRLEDPAIVETLGRNPLEIRLLAIDPEHRGRLVMLGLFVMMHEYACANGHDVLLISAVTSQLNIYERIGFRALGPAVPMGRAAFVPMVAGIDDLPHDKVQASLQRHASQSNSVS